MIKRLAALLIAVAVAAAPVALEACQINCAMDVAQPSCHGHASTGLSMSAGSLPCDHGDTITAASTVAGRTDDVSAASARIVVSDCSGAADTIFDRGRFVSAIDRLDFRLSVPLRI